MIEGLRDGKRSRMFKESAKIVLMLASLLFLMMWLSGAFIQKVEPAEPGEKGPMGSVKTTRVERKSYPVIMEQVGTVRSGMEAQVSSRIMAQVKEVLVQEGFTVEGGNGSSNRGTLLARLDDRDVRARLQQAEAQLTALGKTGESAKARVGAVKSQLVSAKANASRAASDYRRTVELHERQAATGQQLDHAGAQSKMAEAQAQAASRDVSAAESEISRVEALESQAAAAVQEARLMLDHTLIRAPFGGRVIKKLVDVGDMATPGSPLFVIEVSGRPELHAEVSESLLSSLHAGDKLSVTVDAVNARLEGEVREIIPLSDPATRTVQVKVTLPQHRGLVNGLFGRLLIPSGRYDALVVPFRAVREVGQLYLVDVADGKGHAARRFVTLGERHEDLVEVLSGLKEGEEVTVP